MESESRAGYRKRRSWCEGGLQRYQGLSTRRSLGSPSGSRGSRNGVERRKEAQSDLPPPTARVSRTCAPPLVRRAPLPYVSVYGSQQGIVRVERSAPLSRRSLPTLAHISAHHSVPCAVGQRLSHGAKTTPLHRPARSCATSSPSPPPASLDVAPAPSPLPPPLLPPPPTTMAAPRVDDADARCCRRRGVLRGRLCTRRQQHRFC